MSCWRSKPWHPSFQGRSLDRRDSWFSVVKLSPQCLDRLTLGQKGRQVSLLPPYVWAITDVETYTLSMLETHLLSTCIE